MTTAAGEHGARRIKRANLAGDSLRVFSFPFFSEGMMRPIKSLNALHRAVVLAAAMLLLVVDSGSATTNAFNDDLLKKSAQEQRVVLQYLIGDGCRVTRAFFNGIAKRGPAKGRAFWSAACKDGRSFLVMVPPRLEDTRILECEKLKVLGLGSCFMKLKD